ncbi:MAG TPA: NAD-dependent epimerase/dehydratase family protein, partial [Candidatus Paceibacterota bacterium]|nr:NAD-dependent epimerase/dehydratase family protein [Candidatus Paceibacterota bacterium]
ISDLEKVGIPVERKDIARDDISNILDGADVIYHFAAQPGISEMTPFDTYLQNNIVATYKLLEAARKIKSLKLFVFISTSSVYGARADSDETAEPMPTSFYGVTKLAAEQLALSYSRDKNLPVTVLRLFSVYGERERPEKLYHKVIKNVLNNEPLTLYEGSEAHRRSYSYVGDIVDACLLVLDKMDAVKGEIFNIGTDKTITTGEGLALIEKIMGTKIIIKKVPPRPGDQIETAAKIDKARRVLGYDPKVLPKDGLHREVEWYKNKIYNRP